MQPQLSVAPWTNQSSPAAAAAVTPWSQPQALATAPVAPWEAAMPTGSTSPWTIGQPSWQAQIPSSSYVGAPTTTWVNPQASSSVVTPTVHAPAPQHTPTALPHLVPQLSESDDLCCLS